MDVLRHEAKGVTPSERKFGSIIQFSPVAMIVVGREGDIELFNAEAERIFGYTREEVLFQPVEVLIPERYRQGHIHLRGEFSQGPAARLMGAGRELLALRKDGSEFPVEIGLTPLEMEGERWVLCTMVDISVRSEADQALREREEFVRRVLDNLFAFVGVLTSEGTVIQANRAPLEAAGIAQEDVVGKKFWDTFWWNYSPEVQAQLREACERASRGEVIRYDVPVRMASDTRMWIDFQIAPLRDREGRVTHLIPSGMDIRARREAELALRESEMQLAGSLRELREAQDELMRRERLATLGKLAGSVAHEIRTPLCVIQNGLFFLEQSFLRNDETAREVLAEMKRAIGNSDHIITGMLDYVREPICHRTVFPVGDAFASALRSVSLPETILLRSLATEVAAIPVHANLDQVIRILMNLIQNAAQAMPEGGELEIGAIREDGGKVCIQVRDTGCGIPEENLERIYDPLFSTKVRGIGLGLAIAQRYAQFNGGHLSVEHTEVGRGTAFRLILDSA